MPDISAHYSAVHLAVKPHKQQPQAKFIVDFTVGPSKKISTPTLQLSGAEHVLQASFANGEHVFTTSKFDLGIVPGIGGRRLLGWLSFSYEYNPVRKLIKLCGTDYHSPKAMRLFTAPEDLGEVYTEIAAPAVLPLEEAGHYNKYWNHQSPLYSPAAKTFKDIARNANDALIEALKKVPGLAVQVRKPFPDLPLELYYKLCMVYRDGKPLEVYDPSKSYGPSDFIKLPESTFGGIIDLPDRADFANVIGSTNDPHIDNLNWLPLWKQETGRDVNQCTSYGFPNTVTCNNNLLGGHSIQGQEAMEVEAGSDDVMIFPICKPHNDDDSVHMECITNTTAVALENYLEQ